MVIFNSKYGGLGLLPPYTPQDCDSMLYPAWSTGLLSLDKLIPTITTGVAVVVEGGDQAVYKPESMEGAALKVGACGQWFVVSGHAHAHAHAHTRTHARAHTLKVHPRGGGACGQCPLKRPIHAYKQTHTRTPTHLQHEELCMIVDRLLLARAQGTCPSIFICLGHQLAAHCHIRLIR